MHDERSLQIIIYNFYFYFTVARCLKELRTITVNAVILLRKWDYFWLLNGMLYFKLTLSFTLNMVISKYVHLRDMQLILLLALQPSFISSLCFWQQKIMNLLTVS